uniref:Uncharacterized protein n=1 Tax=Nelumbo nucifera TaxID=4432 RepID=A0A822ZFV6_NELNU|nr:TPA_asm: hypothetical protein HUJ06_000559 [Nelumbo nucifera]
MAKARISRAVSFLVVLVVAIFSIAAVAAQDSILAPSPAMATGAGNALPVSGAIICSSLLFSLFAVLSH